MTPSDGTVPLIWVGVWRVVSLYVELYKGFSYSAGNLLTFISSETFKASWSEISEWIPVNCLSLASENYNTHAGVISD